VKGQEEEFREFTKERQNYYKIRFKKLTEISKTFCFDNPESRHLNNLINRIKDGLELIRIQEQNINNFSMSKKELQLKSPSEIEKKQIPNNNDLKKKYQQDFYFSKNIEEDFLKDYNRSGTFNDKFKKIKKKILKKKTSEAAIKYKNEDKNKEKYKKDNKEQAILSNENIQKLKKIENNDPIEYKKKQSNLFSKGKSISISDNINNFDVKSHSKFEKKKNEKISRITLPKKVVELYTVLKNSSKNDHNNIQEKGDYHLDKKQDSLNTIINNENTNIKNIFIDNPEKEIANNNLKPYIWKSIISTNLDKVEKQKKDINLNNNQSAINLNNIKENENKHINKIEIDLGKEMYFPQRLLKNNKSFFPYKIKIRKSVLEGLKNESNNSSNGSPDLSLNFERKEDNVIKKRNCKSGKKISDLDMSRRNLLSSPMNSSNKITELKFTEQFLSKNLKTEKITSIENIKSENNNNFKLIGKENRIDYYDYVLNTYNREVGEINSELYILQAEKENKNKNINDYEMIYSKMQYLENINRRSSGISNSNVKQCSSNDIKVENLQSLNPYDNLANEDVLKMKAKFKNDYIIKGMHSSLGNTKNKCNINNNIKELWEKRKTEIFKNLENKLDKNRKNKIIINSANIKNNLAKKNEVTQNKKELYYSIKKPLITRSHSEIPDLKVNISIFVKENFEKEKSLFNLKDKKNLLQSSEVNKNIFLNSKKISHILNKKYNFLKNHCKDKKVEKSMNLLKFNK